MAIADSNMLYVYLAATHRLMLIKAEYLCDRALQAPIAIKRLLRRLITGAYHEN
jgi:hypothetical protein